MTRINLIEVKSYSPRSMAEKKKEWGIVGTWKAW